MSLATIYQELHRRASETSQDRGHTLSGGARIAVRVRDGQATLTIMRKTKRVGAAELETFKRDCGVPGDAARYPAEDQGQHTDADGQAWWYVVFRWSSE